jgi:hypothetical protein
MEQLLQTIVSARHERYARADLQRAIVRRAETDADWELVARLRRDGFTRVPGVAAEGPWLDELDRGEAAFSLLGFALDGTPLATMRVQDGRRGPLELRRFVDVAEPGAVQFGRLSVLRSGESVHVLFGMCKAAWKWSFDEGLETILLTSPPWARGIYEFMHFESLGEAGRFRHPFAGGTWHETMKLPVQTAEAVWRGQGHPLSDAFFAVHHPMLQA